MNESSIRVTAVIVTVLFGVLTIAAVVIDGGTGFPEAISHNYWSFQIWLDLVIAMIFWFGWMIGDARRAGRSPWGWVVMGLLIGAFAPLIYLIMYQRWPASDVAASESGASTSRWPGVLGLFVLGVVTLLAVLNDGTDVVPTVIHSLSNIQIRVDLVIVMFSWIVWVVKDCHQRGTSPWGWVILALLIGAFSPLLYLVLMARRP